MGKNYWLVRGVGVLAISGVLSAKGMAATTAWLNTGTDWNTAGNWASGLPTSGLSNGAQFTGAAVTNPNVSASYTVGTLQFSSSAIGYSITGSGGASLTLNSYGGGGTGANNAIQAVNASGTNTVSVPLVFTPTGGTFITFNQASGGTLAVNGLLSSTAPFANLNLQGGGNINIGGTSNTYSGATNIYGSTRVTISTLGNAGSAGSLGTGSIVIGANGGTSTAGTLAYIGSGETSNKTVSFGGTTTIDTTGASGGLVLSSAISATNRSVTLTGDSSGNALNGAVGSGTTSITKSGTGTWALGGTNVYTGATTVSAGTLLINGSTAAGSSVGVNGGTLGGTGVVAGAVTVGTGAAVLGGTGLAASDDLAFSGNLTLQNNSILKLALGASGAHSSLTRLGGTWSFDSDQAFLLTNLGATTGLYDNIISGLTGLETGLASIGTWTIQNVGWTGTFAYDGTGGVDLTIVAVPEPSTYTLIALGLAGLYVLRRRSRKVS